MKKLSKPVKFIILVLIAMVLKFFTSIVLDSAADSFLGPLFGVFAGVPGIIGCALGSFARSIFFEIDIVSSLIYSIPAALSAFIPFLARRFLKDRNTFATAWKLLAITAIDSFVLAAAWGLIYKLMLGVSIMSIALPFVLVFLSLSFTISYPVYFLISGIMVKRVRSDRPLLNTFACWMPAQFICCLWFALEVYSITWTTRGINLLSIILDWLFIAFFIMCSNIAMLILATLTGKFRRVMLFVFAAVMTAAAIFNIVTYDTGEGIYFIILMALWLLLHAIFYNWYEMKAMKVKAVKISAAVLHYILLFMLILVMGLSAATNIIPIANGDEHSVIVLGAPVHNNKASTILEDRISVASEYLKKNEAAYAILTGGTKVEGGKTEAETIRDGLVANGISEDRLVLESDAKTTEENFEKSLAIVEKYGGSANEEIVIITSSFHLLRAAIFAQNAGFTKLTGLGADSFFMKDWVWYLREAVSLLPVLLR